jgi:hypothetical protein
VSRIEQEVLRALLAPLFDSGDQVALPREASDELLLAVARHHRLSPALSTLERCPASPAVAEVFRRDRLVTLGRGALLRRALVESVNALGAAGVKSVVLKGMAYEALVYPVPGTRPATDIDLLVRREMRPTAFRVFRSLGFGPATGAPGFDEPDYHEVSLRKDDINIDLHFGLAPFVRGAIDYEALWAATIPLPIDGASAHMLCRPHAALHQALHMAIHHFDVPGLYLLDLARLCAAPQVAQQAARDAQQWRCFRAWETATALTASFVRGSPAWLIRDGSPPHPRIVRVIGSYGGLAPLPRPEQLRRKVEHFDTPTDAARYLGVQARRVMRERLMALRRVPPSASERLRW